MQQSLCHNAQCIWPIFVLVMVGRPKETSFRSLLIVHILVLLVCIVKFPAQVKSVNFKEL